MQILKPIFSQATLQHSLPQDELLDALCDSIKLFPDETVSILKIMNKIIADGLHHQKGTIISFGPSQNCSPTKNVLKFSEVDNFTLDQLNTYILRSSE